MNVRNDYLNKNLIVTDHALERWGERGEGELAERLKTALPFGGQLGDLHLLLLSGDMVFATRDKADCCVVTTCLTKQQAIANMQVYGIRGDFQVESQAGVKSTSLCSRSRIAKEEAKRLSEAGSNPEALSDEDLQSLFLEAVEFRDGLAVLRTQDRHYCSARDRINNLIQALKDERGKRKKAAKRERHLLYMEASYAGLSRAIRELLTEEQSQAVFARANEIRDEKLGRVQ